MRPNDALFDQSEIFQRWTTGFKKCCYLQVYIASSDALQKSPATRNDKKMEIKNRGQLSFRFLFLSGHKYVLLKSAFAQEKKSGLLKSHGFSLSICDRPLSTGPTVGRVDEQLKDPGLQVPCASSPE